MANVNSLMTNNTSSTSSLYGTRNVLSGLASGLDTESMIENSVSGYQTKISSLEQSKTKIEWKQEAYRAITDKIADVTQKYTSYTSKTNLTSAAYFTGAVNTTAEGANAGKVAVSGKSTSDIAINSIQSLATSASYRVNAGDRFSAAKSTTGKAFAWGQQTVGALEGSLTLKNGTQKVTIKFSSEDVYETTDDLIEGIRTKLEDIQVGGKKASDLISVDESGNFSLNSNAGNAFYIESTSGNVGQMFGLTGNLEEDQTTQLQLPAALTKTISTQEALSNQTLTVTLDGTKKRIEIGDLSGLTEEGARNQLTETINSKLRESFGSGVTFALKEENGQYQMDFSVPDGSHSNLSVSLTGGGKVGMDGTLSNFVSTDTKLGDLPGAFDNLKRAAVVGDDSSGKLEISLPAPNQATLVSGHSDLYQDKAGNYYKKISEDPALYQPVDLENGGNNFARVDKDENPLYEMTVNGVSVGYFGKNSTIGDVLNAINNSSAGVQANYSRLTDAFTFNAKQTGVGQEISLGGLGENLFGNGTSEDGRSVFTEGSNAVFTATVNGVETSITRASNTIDMDGMSMTLKGTFSEGDAITFNTKADTENIVSGIKSFVEDFNGLLKSLHDAFATQPEYKNASKRTAYEPLTEKDQQGMSESAIKKYEEKAKTGLLYGDSDISAMYNSLVSTLTSSSVRKDLESMGIAVKYSANTAQLTLDGSKLTSALDRDPDKVKDVFASVTSGGASRNGLMANLKTTLDKYGSTSYGGYGILVQKAGTNLSANSLLNNKLQKQIETVETQISTWQTKMSSRVDYYTRQFSALEKMMQTMNNQSSALAGLMGG